MAHIGSAPVPVPNPTSPYWIKAFPNATKPIIAPRAPTTTTAPGRHRPKLPPTADVVIIGGGIAGVSAAYHLRTSRPDLQVVLLEARQLSHGATGRNGGLLWPALNAPWLKTAARYGESEAARIMAFELQCLDEVRHFIAREGLEEEVRHAPFGDGAFYVYESEDEMAAELAELEVMQKLGIHRDCEPLTRRQTATLLGTGAFVGAVRQPGVSRVWAARLVHALVRLAGRAGPPEGLMVAEDTRVAAVTPLSLPGGSTPHEANRRHRRQQQQLDAAGGGTRRQQQQQRQAAVVAANNIVPVGPGALQAPAPEVLDPASPPLLQVTTDCGERVLARRVIHCTNAYGSSLLPELRAALVPVRNHVAATNAPQPGSTGFPLDAAFFARGGYVYWSRREDGRVVVGGFRDVVPDMEWGVYDDASLDERIRRQLHAYLPARFPAVFGARQQQQQGPHPGGGGLELEAEWSGILGFTQDRFPFVGPVPHRRGQFLAAGFSGHGMTRTFTCGRVLADMVTGAPPDPAFPTSWLPTEGRFGPATPAVPGPEAAAGALYLAAA